MRMSVCFRSPASVCAAGQRGGSLPRLAGPRHPNRPTPDDTESDAVATPSDLPKDAVDLTDKVEVTVNGAAELVPCTSHSVSP